MSREHPADTLRRAADLIRRTAQAADTGEDWEADKHYDDMYCVDFQPSIPNPEGNGHRYLPDDPADPGMARPADIVVHDYQAHHIALWQPRIALCIAQWLEACADGWPNHLQVVHTTTPVRASERRSALELARAVLGPEEENRPWNR